MHDNQSAPDFPEVVELALSGKKVPLFQFLLKTLPLIGHTKREVDLYKRIHETIRRFADEQPRGVDERDVIRALLYGLFVAIIGDQISDPIGFLSKQRHRYRRRRQSRRTARTGKSTDSETVEPSPFRGTTEPNHQISNGGTKL